MVLTGSLPVVFTMFLGWAHHAYTVGVPVMTAKLLMVFGLADIMVIAVGVGLLVRPRSGPR
jgi:hypothetical protein